MTHSNENSPPLLAKGLVKYPTPLHIYYRDRLIEDASELESGLKSNLSGVHLYYSTKTNSLLAALKTLIDRGWSMEVVSEADILAALRAGAAPGSLLLNGFAWTKEFLEKALFKWNVRRLTVDSPAMARKVRECLRQNSRPIQIDVAIRIHDGESHFGVAAENEAVQAVLNELPEDSIRAIGLHLHRNTGGSTRNTGAISEDFRRRALKLLDVEKKTGRDFSFFDLGGGIDSPWVFRPEPEILGDFHHPAKGAEIRRQHLDKRFSLRAIAEEISIAVGNALSGSKPRDIFFEPGRAVCTRAISTLIEVVAVKKGLYPDADIVITDGNTAFMGPIHRGVHALDLVSREAIGPERPVFVYGNLPHSGDWLFQNVGMPELKEGDRLLVSHTGAYFLPLEANFGLPRPGVIDAETGNYLRAPEEAPTLGIRDNA